MPLADDGLTIRRLNPQDPGEVESVCRLWRRARESSMPELEARLGHTAREDLAFFRDTILVERECWIAVGQVEGATLPLAFLALEAETLENLYVDPVWHGRRIGKRLLDHAKKRRPNGFTLYTFQANEGARRFYEREGLEAIEFGVAPPPENEPDVRFAWRPES